MIDIRAGPVLPHPRGLAFGGTLSIVEQGNVGGAPQMMIRLVVAAAVLLAASQTRAEQVRVCEVAVEYKPTGVPSPEINGIWEGTVDYGIRYKECRAFVIEGLDDKGRILGKQAWNHSYGPNTDFRGGAYIGQSAIIITKQLDGTYTSGTGFTFTLRLEGNKLVGKFHNKNDSGDHDVVLIKR
jgi:hypothetical protein